EDFCMSSVPRYLFVVALIYFFTGDASFVQLIKNPASLLNVTQDAGIVLIVLMVASVLLFNVFYSSAKEIAADKKVSSKK
ncbi:MAG: hypothetical protein IJB16_09220, partial [Clostridia bacterium]|nr:hypothetical protein [Clostridia bacterium]